MATAPETSPVIALNVPNTLSAARICAVPFQLHFAFTGQKTIFLVVLLLVLLSDAIDGFIARKTGQESEMGTRLDSLGDFLTYLSLPVCMWGLWPGLIQEEAPFFILGILSFVCPVLVGYGRFRRPVTFHTWGTKLSAVLAGITLLLMMFGDIRWPFRIATLIFCVAGLETIAVTLVLPSYNSKVHSLKRALEIRRGQNVSAA